MDIEKEKYLCETYPILYRNRNKSIYESCMAWGFQCGDGWFDLINDLSKVLEDINKKVTSEEYILAAQVKEKFGCYDEETEVLTKNGWKCFKDVNFTDEIATLRDGEFLEYQKPTDIVSYDYSGDMYKLKTRGVNLLITPNHNLYVAKGSSYNGKKAKGQMRKDNLFELTTYEKFFNKNKCFKKGAIWDGTLLDVFVLPKYENFWDRNQGSMTNKKCPERSIEINKWLKFLGWYIAEGCCSEDKGEVSIACNNVDGGKEKEHIKKIIEDVGYEIKTTLENQSALVFKIYSVQLCNWLKEHCGRVSYEKKVPKFLKELSASKIIIFLNELFSGDGHKYPTSHQLFSVSKSLIDDVQELILKFGQSSTIYKEKPARKSKIKGREVNIRESYAINWVLS